MIKDNYKWWWKWLHSLLFLQQNMSKKSTDRLTLFGLMVKPIQRFPQFIMLIKVNSQVSRSWPWKISSSDNGFTKTEMMYIRAFFAKTSPPYQSLWLVKAMLEGVNYKKSTKFLSFMVDLWIWPNNTVPLKVDKIRMCVYNINPALVLLYWQDSKKNGIQQLPYLNWIHKWPFTDIWRGSIE